MHGQTGGGERWSRDRAPVTAGRALKGRMLAKKVAGCGAHPVHNMGAPTPYVTWGEKPRSEAADARRHPRPPHHPPKKQTPNHRGKPLEGEQTQDETEKHPPHRPTPQRTCPSGTRGTAWPAAGAWSSGWRAPSYSGGRREQTRGTRQDGPAESCRAPVRGARCCAPRGWWRWSWPPTTSPTLARPGSERSLSSKQPVGERNGGYRGGRRGAEGEGRKERGGMRDREEAGSDRNGGVEGRKNGGRAEGRRTDDGFRSGRTREGWLQRWLSQPTNRESENGRDLNFTSPRKSWNFPVGGHSAASAAGRRRGERGGEAAPAMVAQLCRRP